MKNGCGSSVIENVAGVAKKDHSVSFTLGEASMRTHVYSQSARLAHSHYVSMLVVCFFHALIECKTGILFFCMRLLNAKRAFCFFF